MEHKPVCSARKERRKKLDVECMTQWTVKAATSKKIVWIFGDVNHNVSFLDQPVITLHSKTSTDDESEKAKSKLCEVTSANRQTDKQSTIIKT